MLSLTSQTQRVHAPGFYLCEIVEYAKSSMVKNIRSAIASGVGAGTNWGGNFLGVRTMFRIMIVVSLTQVCMYLSKFGICMPEMCSLLCLQTLSQKRNSKANVEL